MNEKYLVVGYTGALNFKAEDGKNVSYAKVFLRKEGSSDVEKFKADPAFDFKPFDGKTVTPVFKVTESGVKVVGCK